MYYIQRVSSSLFTFDFQRHSLFEEGSQVSPHFRLSHRICDIVSVDINFKWRVLLKGQHSDVVEVAHLEHLLGGEARLGVELEQHSQNGEEALRCVWEFFSESFDISFGLAQELMHVTLLLRRLQEVKIDVGA